MDFLFQTFIRAPPLRFLLQGTSITPAFSIYLIQLQDQEDIFANRIDVYLYYIPAFYLLSIYLCLLYNISPVFLFKSILFLSLISLQNHFILKKASSTLQVLLLTPSKTTKKPRGQLAARFSALRIIIWQHSHKNASGSEPLLREWRRWWEPACRRPHRTAESRPRPTPQRTAPNRRWTSHP